MPAKLRPTIRLLAPAGAGPVVLTAHGGRVRGEVLLENEGAAPVEVSEIAITGKLPVPRGKGTQSPEPEPFEPVVVAPGAARPVAIAAEIDRHTPPGAYRTRIAVEGVARQALLQVGEDIALSLSETEIVVVASPGVEQVRHVAMTNLGNVPLTVARLGPVELGVDRPRPTLLQRLGILPLDEVAIVVRTEREPERRMEEEREGRPEREPAAEEAAPRPTVSVRLAKAAEIAPGETVAAEWLISVAGDLRPGARYRGVAALFTTDVRFVVAPTLDEAPADTSPETGARAPRARKAGADRPSAAQPTPQERRTS
jgi:hypothetical protein